MKRKSDMTLEDAAKAGYKFEMINGNIWKITNPNKREYFYHLRTQQCSCPATKACKHQRWVDTLMKFVVNPQKLWLKPGKQLPLGNDKFAIVDEEDYEQLMSMGSWHMHSGGYVAKSFRDKSGTSRSVYMHHIIGRPPFGYEIDHINRNRADNRKLNLRWATTAQNRQNQIGNKKSISIYKGVFPAKNKYRKWHAKIRVDGEIKYLGSFHTEKEAAFAYDKAAREFHGEFACTNFP